MERSRHMRLMLSCALVWYSRSQNKMRLILRSEEQSCPDWAELTVFPFNVSLVNKNWFFKTQWTRIFLISKIFTHRLTGTFKSTPAEVPSTWPSFEINCDPWLKIGYSKTLDISGFLEIPKTNIPRRELREYSPWNQLDGLPSYMILVNENWVVKTRCSLYWPFRKVEPFLGPMGGCVDERMGGWWSKGFFDFARLP